jgi:hypothetical protein
MGICCSGSSRDVTRMTTIEQPVCDQIKALPWPGKNCEIVSDDLIVVAPGRPCHPLRKIVHFRVASSAESLVRVLNEQKQQSQQVCYPGGLHVF